MPPSPTTIPTSFVPKQPVKTGNRFTKSGGNLLLTVGLIMLGLSLLACAGIFGYERYLLGRVADKNQQVSDAEKAIDDAKLESFIRARDRFTAAKDVLDAHVAASRFLDLLERVTLANVRFISLRFTLADDRSAEIQMDGTAKTFNALAAESAAFAAEAQVKRAIFSGIKVNETNKTVSFTLDANLEPDLLTYSTDGLVPATTASSSAADVPAATTTPATTTPL